MPLTEKKKFQNIKHIKTQQNVIKNQKHKTHTQVMPRLEVTCNQNVNWI